MRFALATLLVALCLCGCGPSSPSSPDAGTLDAGSVPDAGILDAGPTPDAGALDAGPTPDAGDLTLSMGEWNVEFFGLADGGPVDDAVQGANVATIMGRADMDLWALEEVCDETAFNQVLDQLRTQYGQDFGVVYPDDPTAVSNPNPSYGSVWHQRTALVYRKSVATVVGADLVHRTDLDPSWTSAFAGTRDPLEVHLQIAAPSGEKDLWVLVIQLKAGPDTGSYAKRQAAAADLHAYLASAHPGDAVIVAGDWNDTLVGSICATCGDSPFAVLVNDTANVLFPTLALAVDGGTTETDFDDSVVDNHMITAPLFGAYLGEVGRVDVSSVDYAGDSTSDHYPTFVRYHLR